MTETHPLRAEAVGEMLVGITQTMFEERFEMDSRVGGVPVLPADAGEMYTCFLSLTGEEPVDLMLACKMSCGSQLAGKMFSCDPEGLDTGLAADAVGEILNIVAGQVKSHLASHHQIGLPAVTKQKGIAKVDTPSEWSGVFLDSPSKNIKIWLGFRNLGQTGSVRK